MRKQGYKWLSTTFLITFLLFSGLAISSENTSLTPERFQLGQNYPNPFNPTTQFDYSVPVESEVVIKVYNILGQEIRTLVNGNVPRGVYTIEWNGKNNQGLMVANGVYMYRIEAKNIIAGSDQTFTETRKMILVR